MFGTAEEEVKVRALFVCACIRDCLLNWGVYSSGVLRIKVIVRHPGFWVVCVRVREWCASPSCGVE